MFQKNEIDKLKLQLNQTLKFVLFLSMPMCLGMIAVADYFIPLFLGDGFYRSVILLKIFSLLLVVVGLNNAVGKQILMAIGKQAEYNKAVIGGALTNMILNKILIPKMLSVGAAVASVLAETVILILFVYFGKQYIVFKQMFKAGKNYLFAASIMFLALRVSYHWLEMSWLSVCIQILMGIVIYISVIFMLRDEFVCGFIKRIFK